MKISIITATYNSAKTLSDCIRSINDQTYQDIESVFIDGGSKDNTLELIQLHANKKSKVISEPDSGIYDALNKGISNATGDVIGFLHSDDLFASDETISHIAMTFQETGADLVYGDLDYVDKNNINKVYRYWKSKPFEPALIKKGWMAPHSTLFMKKEVYSKHGEFDLSFQIAADYDYMLRIFSDMGIKTAYIPEVIIKMRTGGKSNRSINNIFRKSSEDYRALIKNRIPFPMFVLMLKNVSKLNQFIKV